MFTLTIKELVARKMRLLNTVFAVLLGVTLMAGTLVFTDTLTATFDNVLEDARAGVDALGRIDDPALEIDEKTILIMRGAGPVGYPGAAEVVNMRAPDYLLKKGITSLPCIGDGRQSGTSGSPSILNASPEAAAPGSGLAILKTGDMVRIDLNRRSADILISNEEIEKRKAALAKAGGYKYPESQTPWQEIQRGMVDELSEGMVLKPAVKYQRIAKTKGLPRDNH